MAVSTFCKKTPGTSWRHQILVDLRINVTGHKNLRHFTSKGVGRTPTRRFDQRARRRMVFQQVGARGRDRWHQWCMVHWI